MTQEEKNIKNKIDNLSDLDVFFNDTHLWERVEARLDQKKTRKGILVWYWVAASIAIGLSFYFFAFPVTTPQKNYAVTKTAATFLTKPIKEIQPESHNPKVFFNKNKAKVSVLINDSIENNEAEEKLLNIGITQLNAIDKPLISPNSKDIGQIPIAFKAQRITTLTLPIIPDEMMQRESFAKRALRQIKSFNNEGKIDLRELNIEPRNVWAYLERSFLHDTTKITKLKPLKQ